MPVCPVLERMISDRECTDVILAATAERLERCRACPTGQDLARSCPAGVRKALPPLAGIPREQAARDISKAFPVSAPTLSRSAVPFGAAADVPAAPLPEPPASPSVGGSGPSRASKPRTTRSRKPKRDPRLDILAGVLAYALPRYSKQPRLGVRFLRLLMAEQGQEIEVEDLAELCRRAGLDLATVKRAPYVLINPRAWALAKEAA